MKKAHVIVAACLCGAAVALLALRHGAPARSERADGAAGTAARGADMEKPQTTPEARARIAAEERPRAAESGEIVPVRRPVIAEKAASAGRGIQGGQVLTGNGPTAAAGEGEPGKAARGRHPAARERIVQGQFGEALPLRETVGTDEAQNILRYYRSAEAERPRAEVSSVTGDTEAALDEIAARNIRGDAGSRAADIEALLKACAEGNPLEVRMEAMYLLADIEPALVLSFLNDKDEIIRLEAERLAGIMSEE